MDFMKLLEKAQSIADIEDVFEVDHFLKSMAIEYLTGSWDNLRNRHNYYLYKQPNGKWIYLSNDFDHSFGINTDVIVFGTVTPDLPELMVFHNMDYPNYSLEDWMTNEFHIINISIFKDPSRFNQILKSIVENVYNHVYNPTTLYHI